MRRSLTKLAVIMLMVTVVIALAGKGLPQGGFSYSETVAGPEDLDLRAEYGVALALCGDLARSERMFMSILAIAPGDARAWVNLGNLHLLRGDTGVALASYDRARAADSMDAGILLNTSIALMIAGRAGEAQRQASRALLLAGSLEEACSLLGISRGWLEAEESRSAETPILSKDEVLSLLKKVASSVPADSAGVGASGDTLRSIPPNPPADRMKPRAWRPAGTRSADRTDLAMTLYWKQ
jgi:tetratricopeptide (TPR) repeat protein